LSHPLGKEKRDLKHLPTHALVPGEGGVVWQTKKRSAGGRVDDLSWDRVGGKGRKRDYSPVNEILLGRREGRKGADIFSKGDRWRRVQGCKG